MLGVPTPATCAMIEMASTMHGVDYWRSGRTVDRLGIRGMSVKEIRFLVVGMAGQVRRHLQGAVEETVYDSEMGSWLSGGLDSSAIAALLRPSVRTLHTFAAGVAGAPDLECARLVARHLKTVHHEVVVTPAQMLEALPDVIYHLESFDALLVRSSVTNYLVAREAAQYVAEVHSGEGGDERFAGYEYLKAVDLADLAAELLDITGRLHNTALQRVDRAASAHGLVAHVCFLNPAVVDCATRVPPRYKIHDGVEKRPVQ